MVLYFCGGRWFLESSLIISVIGHRRQYRIFFWATVSCTESKAFTLGFDSSFSAALRSHCLLACSEAPPPDHRPSLPLPGGWAWGSVSRSSGSFSWILTSQCRLFHKHPRGRSGLPWLSRVAASGLAEPPTAHTDLCCSLSLWTEQAWCWGQPGAANSLPWKVCVSPCIMATAGTSPVSAGRAEYGGCDRSHCKDNQQPAGSSAAMAGAKLRPNTCYFLSFSFWWVDSNIFMFIILIVVL